MAATTDDSNDFTKYDADIRNINPGTHASAKIYKNKYHIKGGKMLCLLTVTHALTQIVSISLYAFAELFCFSVDGTVLPDFIHFAPR